MEEKLIAAAKSGDKEAFAQLYMLYKDKLYRYAYYRLGNEADAMDALSMCITHAFAGIGALQSEKAFGAWLFKIMHFSCAAVLRERQKHANHADLDTISPAALSEPANTLSVELKQALAQLSETEREIVLLSAIAGYKSREIAALTGSTPGTVRSTLSRSLAKMRQYLGDER
ncbi:MAG: sigma-70 family RNA polymerase sigma factor [Clostridia bacterium]|nr:sigma-70 family RNA polymerase sigma factor [Clostridia bacterium]